MTEYASLSDYLKQPSSRAIIADAPTPKQLTDASLILFKKFGVIPVFVRSEDVTHVTLAETQDTAIYDSISEYIQTPRDHGIIKGPMSESEIEEATKRIKEDVGMDPVFTHKGEWVHINLEPSPDRIGFSEITLLLLSLVLYAIFKVSGI